MMSNAFQRIARTALVPISRAGLPTGAILSRLGLAYRIPPARWAGPTDVVVRRRDGQRMRLDLNEWTDRIAYFTGRYYEKHTEEVMTRLLRPGDAAIDVGGNNGLLMLHAARAVGPAGRVNVFEPNPQMAERIREQLSLNQLPQVTLHETALGAESGAATLTVPTGYPGTGSLAAATVDGPVDTFDVPVRRADDVLRDRKVPVRLVKIDVEGFEVSVLRGMEALLSADRPFVICECLPELLTRAGSSHDEMFADMAQRRYEPFALGTKRRGLRTVLSVGGAESADYLWVPVEAREEFEQLFAGSLVS